MTFFDPAARNTGFGALFADIARLASGNQAEILLFSLWTHNAEKLGVPCAQPYFRGSPSIRRW